MTEELRECPFCGGKATLAEYINDDGVAWKYDGLNGFIECLNDDCHMSGYHAGLYFINDDDDVPSKEQVIKAWNTRAQQELLDQAKEALEKADASLKWAIDNAEIVIEFPGDYFKYCNKTIGCCSEDREKIEQALQQMEKENDN